MYRLWQRRAAWLAAPLLLGLASCQASPSDLSARTPPQVRQSIAALGRFEPKDRVIDISVPGDERLSRILVKEGQRVKQGEILAYLETYESRVAARNRAATTLQEAGVQLDANLALAQARIRESELQRDRLKEISNLEIQAQEAKLREVQADLDLAIHDLERFGALQKSNVIPAQQYERQSSYATRVRASLESEDANLQKLKAGATTDRRIAEAQLVTRQAEMDTYRAGGQLESMRRAVELAEAELQRAIIRAPSDGQIIEMIAKPGESLTGRVLLRMGDVSQMYVLAEVYEADVSHVRLGAGVEVTSSALSRPLTGTVERIGTNVLRRQVPDLDPQADTDVRVVQVRARLDNADEAARFVGLQVDARIQIQE